MRNLLILFLPLTLLAACTVQTPLPAAQSNTPPGSVEVSSAQGTPVPAATPAAQPQAEPVVVQSDSANLSSQIDQLSGRLALVQEQVINQRTLSEQQLELSQAILQRLQLLTQSTLLNTPEPANESANQETLEQLDAAVNQLLQVANEVQLSSGGGEGLSEWAIESVVTAQGWILMRYKPASGTVWLAENGSWTELVDTQAPGAGIYALRLQRRDTDSKGYVAVRINQQTGDTWWLNDRTWQPY